MGIFVVLSVMIIAGLDTAIILCQYTVSNHLHQLRDMIYMLPCYCHVWLFIGNKYLLPCHLELPL